MYYKKYKSINLTNITFFDNYNYLNFVGKIAIGLKNLGSKKINLIMLKGLKD